MESSASVSPRRPVPPAGRRRWVICGLLFAATAINYIDRQMIGVLKPTLQSDLGWTETDYADMILWFQAAYAVGYLLMGRFIDAVGARAGYALTFGVWTLAHIMHGLVSGMAQFAAARLALGLGESGNFPAGLKAVSDWFPQRERALAVGIFNAGSNVGAIVTPLVVPVIALAYGWQAAFVLTGAFSLIWLVAWLWMYRRPSEHGGVSAEELAWIEGDRPADAATGAIGWRVLLRHRETWAYAGAKFLTDPIWWMFLFWLPDFLGRRHGLDLRGFGPPLVAIYVMADIGSIAGGWSSSRMLRMGRSANMARKATMLICALAVTPIVFAQAIDQLWLAVLVIGLATAAHQGFSANLLTLPSDLFPRSAVGSVVGIGGMAGAIGGMLMAKYAGYVLDAVGSYTPIFAVAGSAYLVALLLLHLLSPRLTPAAIAAA